QFGAQMAEHPALERAVDLLPQRQALLGFQALEQRGDLGWMQALEQLAHALVAAVGKRLDHLFAQRKCGRFGLACGVVAVVGVVVVHGREDTRGSSDRAPMPGLSLRAATPAGSGGSIPPPPATRAAG